MTQNGDRVRDRVTGFEGIVTVVAEQLTGCRRCWVEAPSNDEGIPQERWIDDARLEVLEVGVVVGHPKG